MYNTNMMNNRYVVRCLRVSADVKAINFIVDTGAKFSCCNYELINGNLEEKELSGNKIKWIGGFIKGYGVKFYQYRLKQFTIGNIDMGIQDIWITFDERVTDTVLGMDMLQKIIFTANPYNKKIYFCKDAEDYEQNFQLKVG
ncbi:MAG: retroviral-like aspartic protease family protein [Lachnospiraceae bacterium]|nr:retroviral-like aspartic protease family protein [Lachnospiraceae bacterium]